jgi:hypothetical protein
MFYVLYPFVTYLLDLPRIYSQMVGRTMNWMVFGRNGRGLVEVLCWNLPGGLTEIMIGLIQDSRWPSKYSNRALPEHVSYNITATVRAHV